MTCDACREPVLWALDHAGRVIELDPEPSPHGNHTIAPHRDGRTRTTQLRPNQITGARQYGQKLYQLHRKTCTKALSNRRY